MNPGALNKPITIEELTRVPQPGGGHSEEWATFDEARAAIEPLEGMEQVRAMSLGMTQPTRFRLRYRPGVTTAMRVRYNGKTYDIRSVINPNERNRWLRLLAEGSE